MTKKFEYRHKRYLIQAKRPTDEEWSEWTRVDDFDEAVKHARHAEEVGFCSRIIDKKASENCNDCANNKECEKAKHVENYRLKGCSDFKSKENEEWT